MEVKNRRRQDSPFTCLKPLIRVWGVATAIGECPVKTARENVFYLFGWVKVVVS